MESATSTLSHDQQSGSETPGASSALLLVDVDHAHPQCSHAGMPASHPFYRNFSPYIPCVGDFSSSSLSTRMMMSCVGIISLQVSW